MPHYYLIQRKLEDGREAKEIVFADSYEEACLLLKQKYGDTDTYTFLGKYESVGNILKKVK